MEGTCRLRLLGPVQVERDGEPVGGFESRKALALLGYLAVHDGPIPRVQLVDLLWPEHSEARGRANLSWVLNRISTLLPACLEADRHTVGFRQGSPYWLDTNAFEELETQGQPASLAAAVELYRGEFLEGLYLRGCPEFEIWLVGERERWRQRVAQVLEKLVRHHGQPGQLEQSLGYARRLLALEPWREETHRQVMRLLAWSEQRGAALAQYETCCRILAEELGVEPAAETTRLYEQIRDGELEVAPALPHRFPDLPAQPLPFLLDEEEPVERPVFVARERELARLDGFLDQALAGRGRVVFVTGEAGQGKTALVGEFARRAQAAHPDLVVASGYGNAYTGVGDPYLPFREVLSLLTGDVEARYAAGAISRDHTSRLWNLLPLSIQAMLEGGPDLIETFLPGPALVQRGAAFTPAGGDWLARLTEVVEDKSAMPPDPNLQQSALFEQYTRVLTRLAVHRPLLLVLDDLQWADGGSTNLLFHLGRRIEGGRVLIVGAYRPEEVAMGRGGERHPLEPVVNEFKRYYGDIEVDLARAEDRGFVEAFLDTEPNRLGDAFRETLYRQTRGHPLFTVELLSGMKERGDLVQDEGGCWLEGRALDWETLPGRVEAVIAERIGRLPAEWQAILTTASVEGEEFTAEIVAHVQAADERKIIQCLSGQLSKQHRLVVGHSLVRLNPDLSEANGGQRLSRYRFRHYLFQKYLYQRLDEVERVHLHQAMGQALETLYAERVSEIAARLARHFQAAGLTAKAVDYLLQAGDRARDLYAFQEAIDFYERALAFLKDGGDVERAARTLMKLGLTYHLAFRFKRAREAYEEGFALWQRAGPGLATPLPPAPHPLRLPGWDPVTLDPAISSDEWSGSLIRQLFSGLVRFNAELDVMPDLALSWEMLANGERYVFHLRDDARWSDGVSVTAEDIVYAWHRVLDPALGSPDASYLYDIEGAQDYHQGRLTDVEQLGVRALDETTLLVELEGPTSYFPQLLTQPNAFPVPRHAVEAHGEAWTRMEHLVTNGPFRLESWQRGASMVLTRDPEYRGQFTGNVDQVELTLNVNSPAEQLALYESDRLDIVFLNPSPEANRLRRQYAAEYISGPSLYTQYVGLNANQPPFDDPRVRRAFALAVDKEKLASLTLSGYYFPATGGFVPPGMPGHSPDIGLPYDPECARRLLAESGYQDGRDFPVVEGVMVHKEQAMLDLAEDWYHTLGVEVVWKIVDWGSLLARLDRDPPPLFRLAWQADYPDPDNLLRLGPPRTHWFGWASDAYVDLLEQARRITDHGERIAVYQRADRLLIEEAVILPIVYGRQHWLVKPWVRQFSPSALYWTLWGNVIIEPH